MYIYICVLGPARSFPPPPARVWSPLLGAGRDWGATAPPLPGYGPHALLGRAGTEGALPHILHPQEGTQTGGGGPKPTGGGKEGPPSLKGVGGRSLKPISHFYFIFYNIYKKYIYIYICKFSRDDRVRVHVHICMHCLLLPTTQNESTRFNR